MSNVLLQFASYIDSCTKFLFRTASFLCILLVFLTFEQVIARYFFNASSVALQELQWHLFGFVILLSVAHVLKQDEHVRVDFLATYFSDRIKKYIDISGLCSILILSAFLIFYGTRYTLQAFHFENPRAPDFYTSQYFSKESFPHKLITPVEKTVRSVLLQGESSPDPGGLEARWIIKALFPFAMLLLFLQALSLLISKLFLPTREEPHGS